MSTVGRIVTNPTAYLLGHPHPQRSTSPALPDVTGGGGVTTTLPSHALALRPGPDAPDTTGRLTSRPPTYPVVTNRGLSNASAEVPGPEEFRSFTVRASDSAPTRPSEVVSGATCGTEADTRTATHTTTGKDINVAQTQLHSARPNRPSPVQTSHSPINRIGQPILTTSGDYEFATASVRLRPHSGGGILDCGTNVAHGLPAGGLWNATEFSDERLMDLQHNEEIKTITMVLELCELLAELAERRASVLADCTVTTSLTAPSRDSPSQSTRGRCSVSPVSSQPQDGVSPPESDATDPPTSGTTGLKFLSEAQRIVEQIVLYRRILYYLEYVFVQVKKAFHHRRLKSTPTSCRRLTDCNALYHRCYIRLRQLARLSRRDDLIEPVGRLLANITANRLIFQYALVQCQAAEMDEYVGEISQSIQRYKAGITLIHGLRQHAKSIGDKNLLADCMRLLHDRYNSLRTAAAKTHNRTCFYTRTATGTAESTPSRPTSNRSPTSQPITVPSPLDPHVDGSPVIPGSQIPASLLH